MTALSVAELLHLVDRAEAGRLLPAEAHLLRDGITALAGALTPTATEEAEAADRTGSTEWRIQSRARGARTWSHSRAYAEHEYADALERLGWARREFPGQEHRLRRRTLVFDTVAPHDPTVAPHGPQDAATTVRAGTEASGGGTGPQTGADSLAPGQIADQLDEFIAQSADGASEDWLRGARCITGRLRLADPAALRDA